MKKRNVYMTTSNEGDQGKTTWLKLLIEALMRRNVKLAIYQGDPDHLELMNSYPGQVQLFDSKTDRDGIVTAIDNDAEHVAIDLPAGSVIVSYNIFKDMNSFLRVFEMANALPIFLIPVVSVKSLSSVEKVSELMRDSTGEYKIVYCLNEGLMPDIKEVTKAFEQNMTVKENIVKGIAKVMKITTIFTPQFAEIVDNDMLRASLTATTSSSGKRITLMDKALMHDLLRKTDDQFEEIFDLEKIDDRTGLEKHFAPEIEKAKIADKKK